MAPTQTILRFPQSRKKSTFVLVQAVSTGSHPLDLRLVGTDGFSPFVTTFRHERVSRLKHSCPDEEWEEVLESIFAQRTPEGVEATAKVEEGQDVDDPPSHLTIEVRRTVQEITKHLGDITLRYKGEEPIDVVEWCSASVQAHEECRASLVRESDRVAKLEKEVEELQAQLDEFIEAKQADEAGLMEKFRDLLNEKKVKIREQQRLLADAPQARAAPPGQDLAVPEGQSPDIKIEEEEEEVKGRTPAPSRRSKRKAAATADDSSDGDFEKMDVDEQKGASPPPPPDSEDDRTTDAASEGDATASEDDSEENATTKPAAGLSARGKEQGEEKAATPPPVRELPFARRKAAKAKPPPKAVDSETESDDEL